MQTSRFQLGLIATLAVGLGFSLRVDETGQYGYCAASAAYGARYSVSGYRAQP